MYDSHRNYYAADAVQKHWQPAQSHIMLQAKVFPGDDREAEQMHNMIDADQH